MNYERIHLYISGVVQGVGYRVATFKMASELGLVGWVKNLDDGRVEVTSEGPEGLNQKLLTFCLKGPPHARVSDVSVAKKERIGELTFSKFDVL